jgi:hypothetical protein
MESVLDVGKSLIKAGIRLNLGQRHIGLGVLHQHQHLIKGFAVLGDKLGQEVNRLPFCGHATVTKDFNGRCGSAYRRGIGTA